MGCCSQAVPCEDNLCLVVLYKVTQSSDFFLNFVPQKYDRHFGGGLIGVQKSQWLGKKVPEPWVHAQTPKNALDIYYREAIRTDTGNTNGALSPGLGTCFFLSPSYLQAYRNSTGSTRHLTTLLPRMLTRSHPQMRITGKGKEAF